MDSKYSTHAARQSSTCVDQISRQEMSLPTTCYSFDNTPNKAQFLTRSPSLTVLKNGILALRFSSWLDWLFFRSAWSRLCTGLVLVLGWLGGLANWTHTERPPPALLLRQGEQRGRFRKVNTKWENLHSALQARAERPKRSRTRGALTARAVSTGVCMLSVCRVF